MPKISYATVLTFALFFSAKISLPDTVASAQSSSSSSVSILDTMEAQAQIKYNANPKSEEAAIRYAMILMQTRKLDNAQAVTDQLLSLNPNSKTAAVLEAEIAELKDLHGARPSKEMEDRHIKEFSEASQADIFAFAGMTPGVKLPSFDNSTFVQNAIKEGAARKEKIKAKYPLLCGDSPAPAERRSEMQVQQAILELQINRGNEGLEEGYPMLLADHPDSREVYRSYSKFLLERSQYEKATEIVSAGNTKFPNDAELQVIADGVDTIRHSNSVEQKNAAVRETLQNSMDLALAKMECPLK